MNLAPLLPLWEKGLGDEGARWGEQPGSRFNLINPEDPHPKSLSQRARDFEITYTFLLPFSPRGRRGWGMRVFGAGVFGVRIGMNLSVLMGLRVSLNTSTPFPNLG
ncbi:MAG: hypothetical protein EA367_05780 [Leptolyngbya sp. DLM2.Bin15]|nr:MAG: hypothetical protein EA367_05780 [Leptolyngbya sp. DLM2.Bin15]